MGVSFWVCTKCGDTYPDCSSDCTFCDACEAGFCSEECAAITDANPEGVPEDEKMSVLISCVDCRGENASDENLLGFALKKLGVDIVALRAEYLAMGASELPSTEGAE